VDSVSPHPKKLNNKTNTHAGSNRQEGRRERHNAVCDCLAVASRAVCSKWPVSRDALPYVRRLSTDGWLM
jgi:hypothetical protein